MAAFYPGRGAGRRLVLGGIDSGAVFLSTYHLCRTQGWNLGRLKAFTLSFGDGPDLGQAREFLQRLGLELFLEPIEADLDSLDVAETIRVVEDYKPLDIESASMFLTLSRCIRQRYPDWKYLLDGDGGDENLKDYPIEENPELTIRSVIHNQMLYQEGWGVGLPDVRPVEEDLNGIGPWRSHFFANRICTRSTGSRRGNRSRVAR